MLCPWAEIDYLFYLFTVLPVYLFLPVCLFTVLLVYFFTFGSLAPKFYFLLFYSFTFLLLRHWLQHVTCVRFHIWANGSDIAFVLHLLTKPQLRNRTEVDPKRLDSRFLEKLGLKLSDSFPKAPKSTTHCAYRAFARR